ncbi:ERF family protein [Halobacillus locisalis]|uniref:ERF family protein n=1 Tax=Halobacillus locisalis TaxID=220753 RepID=A0A838CY39_9BACI|nr:ERF family protein [Halobacillus locisalis]MBA2176838.1 ERF family protein [Halobacillus locisalis]
MSQNNENGKTMERKQIHSALVKAIGEMSNPALSADNPFFKSKYVPLSDILELARPILAKQGIAILQTPSVRYEQQQGNNTQVAVVKICTTIIHDSGETIEIEPFELKADKPTPQSIGSAITYGRRYNITSILGIAGADDDGNVTEQGNGQSQPQDNQQPQQPPQTAISSVEAKIISAVDDASPQGKEYVKVTLEKGSKKLQVIAIEPDMMDKSLKLEQNSVEKFHLKQEQGINYLVGIGEHVQQ